MGEGEDRRGSGTVCISLMVPCYACREFSGGNGGMEHVDREGWGSARLVGWELRDTIGNDYINCIVVTFANRSRRPPSGSARKTRCVRGDKVGTSLFELSRFRFHFLRSFFSI